jgi:predicted TIM-barrel fold metal-dependent hydrolase
MIDTHLHVVPPQLPGVGALHPVLRERPETVADVLLREMQSAGVNAALAMGCWNPPESEAAERDPLGIAQTLLVARNVPGLHAVGVADPTRSDAAHLRRVATVLAGGQAKALKGYLGYLHFAPDHVGYQPYYELAERHRLPFIVHTGDTYSPYAKLKYAQPLLIDEVAVDHPQVRFVMAHVGNPWLTEAVEVVYKNVNVWVDLSGLVVGDAAAFEADEQQDTLHDAMVALRRAFRYAERPNRFLYGSDWPLAPMLWYRRFIAAAIPEGFHSLIFEENARQLLHI